MAMGRDFLRTTGLGIAAGVAVLVAGGQEPYVWRNVAIGGGGFVAGVEFHPGERGLAYARTDVGGAYRWDPLRARWVPLLDGLGQADWNLQGVESIAIDPTNTNRVYAACGTYTLPLPEIGNGAILRSCDRGATWERTMLPLKLGANEAGRGSGERLVVDPNKPERLYFGTRRDGLWQSDDRGATWSRAAGFPDIPDESVKHPLKPGQRYNHLSQAVGIVWVRLHAAGGRRGEPTPVVYAAISRTGESIFRSTDAGRTWATVPGQPTPLRPVGAVIAPDGTLYVTYGDDPGPHRMRDGAVWKYSPATGAWTDVTPERAKGPAAGFGYAGVCLDPAKPETVFVSTWSRDPVDEIYRSRDGGRTWQPLLRNASWDHSSAPYASMMTHHWLSDLEIDPYQRNRLVFNTGYGLWASTNMLTAGPDVPSHWEFHNRGIEETVPLALISPPAGAHLLSGVGDIDGFVHDDFNVSPVQGKYPAPGYKNTEWLDFAEARPAVIIRSGTTYHDDRIHAALSEDGGRTWAALPTEPSHPGGGPRFTIGPVAISADAGTIVWTPLGHAPHFSDDRGRTWRQAPLGADVRVVGDRVESSTWYAYDAQARTLLVSTDGGRSFVVRQQGLAAPEPMHSPYGELVAVPGRAGECWLAVGGKLFRFTEHAKPRVEFPRLSAVEGVGFGRAAPGASHPAVFVTGCVDGISGVYRSDDEGASWIRVTDDAHQFGRLGRVTGDPRIFGRVYVCTSGRGIVYGEPHPEAGTKAQPQSK